MSPLPAGGESSSGCHFYREACEAGTGGCGSVVRLWADHTVLSEFLYQPWSDQDLLIQVMAAVLSCEFHSMCGAAPGNREGRKTT